MENIIGFFTLVAVEAIGNKGANQQVYMCSISFAAK